MRQVDHRHHVQQCRQDAASQSLGQLGLPQLQRTGSPYADFPKSMKGKIIKKIPADSDVIPLPGEDPLHV
eukprot:14781410-Ditylum_brightwellii.AAC.1